MPRSEIKPCVSKFWVERRYLVDPRRVDMPRSEIKPCVSKFWVERRYLVDPRERNMPRSEIKSCVSKFKGTTERVLSSTSILIRCRGNWLPRWSSKLRVVLSTIGENAVRSITIGKNAVRTERPHETPFIFLGLVIFSEISKVEKKDPSKAQSQ